MKSTFHSVPKSRLIGHVAFRIHVSSGTFFFIVTLAIIHFWWPWHFEAHWGSVLQNVSLLRFVCFPVFVRLVFSGLGGRALRYSSVFVIVFTGTHCHRYLTSHMADPAHRRVNPLSWFVLCILWKADTIYTAHISGAESYGLLTVRAEEMGKSIGSFLHTSVFSHFFAHHLSIAV